MKFGFLLFDQFEDLDFVGPWEMIATWSQQFNGPKELFLVSESGNKVTSVKGLTLEAPTSFEQCPQLDYLLVPGGKGARVELANESLLSFIRNQAGHCQQVLSVCTGALLLQAAGLLSGKKATTYWSALKDLDQHADVEVVEARYVRDGSLWTSAGISAGIDMSLAFIAAMAGEKVAGDVQLHTEYYPEKKYYQNSKAHFPNYVD